MHFFDAKESERQVSMRALQPRQPSCHGCIICVFFIWFPDFCCIPLQL